MNAAQGALQAEEAVLHVRGQVDDAPQVIGSPLQAPQGLFHLLQLGLEHHCRVGHLIKNRLGVRHRPAQNLDALFHRVQNVRQVAQVRPEAVGPLVQNALAAGKSAPGRFQLVQALGGGVKPALNVRQRVQQIVQAAGEGPVVLLQIVLALAELGNLLQLGQGGGHHQHRHTPEGKVVAANPDGEVPLLPGQTEKEDGPQVAHQLNLGPLGFQGEDVVLVEQGRGRQGVVAAGVIACIFIGHDVQENLHHAPLPRQVLRLGGDPVEGVAQRDGPGQVFEGLLRFALKIEMVRRAVREAEGGASLLSNHRGGGVGEIHHLVVNAVVRQAVPAVHGVAFYHAALQQIAVIIQRGIVRLVIGGGHAVAYSRRRGGQGQRHGQNRRQSQGGRALCESFPGHTDPSI